MKKYFWFILLLVLSGCRRNNDYEKIFNDPNLYCGTVHELNTIVMGNNFSPMVASRNYLYAAVAGYEVIAAANPEKFNSLAGQLRGLPAMPKARPDQKINFSLAALLAYCKLGESVTFPAGSMKRLGNCSASTRADSRLIVPARTSLNPRPSGIPSTSDTRG